jgi:phosphoglycolate phosphatase-like HAD superfamily hydrolase
MTTTLYTLADLTRLPRRHDSFVGIDSDGCVFDTMSVKQREHFHPLIIRFWGLEACADEFRACTEFVNMYSKTRGSNRFPALLRSFELLHAYPGLRERGVPLPKLDALRAYIHAGLPLGNPSLKAEAERTGDPELRRLLDWSLAINADIDARMRPVPPFLWARRALDLIRTSSDAIVVSQTPEQALIKEWDHHGLRHLVDLIAGQELGAKSEHLRLATAGKYASDRVLMIGDAAGDHAAAQRVGALFYPIVPGEEERSWQRFCEEGYGRFLSGTFAGEYAGALAEAFNAALPDVPPWQP